jgi:hypothetical protein
MTWIFKLSSLRLVFKGLIYKNHISDACDNSLSFCYRIDKLSPDKDSSDEDSGGQTFLHESEHSCPHRYICPHLSVDFDIV